MNNTANIFDWAHCGLRKNHWWVWMGPFLLMRKVANGIEWAQSYSWENLPKGLNGPICYVLVERSARHELDGYNFDAVHIVLEAYTSDTLWELLVHWCMGGTGLRGRGRYPRCTRCSGGICMFCASRLDWHENSDLRSKSATGTSYILLRLDVKSLWYRWLSRYGSVLLQYY